MSEKEHEVSEGGLKHFGLGMPAVQRCIARLAIGHDQHAVTGIAPGRDRFNSAIQARREHAGALAARLADTHAVKVGYSQRAMTTNICLAVGAGLSDVRQRVGAAVVEDATVPGASCEGVCILGATNAQRIE